MTLLFTPRHPLGSMALIGSACGWGAQKAGTEDGPELIQKHLEPYLQEESHVFWMGTAHPPLKASDFIIQNVHDSLEFVNIQNIFLSYILKSALEKQYFPVVIGGDHAMAVGTWSTMTTQLKLTENFGLIWVDAHMDAHTGHTTPSGRYHGMPVAALLASGEKKFADALGPGPKIHPAHLVLVGVRSFEAGEYEFLKSQNVRIYFMDEINNRGLRDIFSEIREHFHGRVQNYGISLDLDAFDPKAVPGVGSPAPGGICPDSFLQELHLLVDKEQLRALEIAEFNHHRDHEGKTLDFVCTFIKKLYELRK